MGAFGDEKFGNAVVVRVIHMFFESLFEGYPSLSYVIHSIEARDFIYLGA